MARPTTKNQLKQAGEENFKKLFALIDSLTPEQRKAPFAFDDRDRNVRDVLVHLYEWHQLLLKWIHANRSGRRANFLPDPYNWKTYPQMNAGFWERHQNTPLEEAVALLQESHGQAMSLIDTFTNEELFTAKHFSWTGTTSLGSYCVSATSSHYEWAVKKIRMHKKNLNGGR